jgi:hypothetical protein
MKIPLKTKVFTWYLRRGVILTKDNLVKRNWQGSKKCVFCLHDETTNHLFSSVNLRDLYGQNPNRFYLVPTLGAWHSFWQLAQWGEV